MDAQESLEAKSLIHLQTWQDNVSQRHSTWYTVKENLLPSDIRFRLHDISAQLANISSNGEMVKVDKTNFLEGKHVTKVYLYISQKKRSYIS